ncbi:MAG: acylphosphatase [Candidatus Cloacimonetes bacterium]|nr:acylphosphatase [Candidatus Cloacimonadota bacterium]
MKCCEVNISGRVQGVGFRWFVKEQAERYGIHGHVRNLPDGRVEVVACAHELALGDFLNALRQGPGHAHITEFNKQERAAAPTHKGFRIAY